MPNFIREFKWNDWWVAAVLAVVAALFLWPAWGDGYYAPADTVRNMPLFIDGSPPHNPLLTDPAQQFLPWWRLSGDLWRQGQLPLWNQYSGGGLPLAANLQSAVWFPLTWLFYFLPMAAALALSAWLKLWLAAWFAYKYLRSIKIERWLATVGGVCLMSSGFMTDWLAWPQTNVVWLLPAAWWLWEKYLASGRASGWWLAAALALGLAGGHPETWFQIVAVWLIYAVARLWQTRAGDWPGLRRGVAGLAGCLAVAALLSAPVWLPFVEYLVRSAVWLARSGDNNFFVPEQFFSANWLPALFGNPALGAYFNHRLNYNEISGGYVGIVMSVAALYAVIWRWRDQATRWLTFLILAVWGVVYKVPLIYNLVVAVPGFSHSANQRLLLLAAWAVVILGVKGWQTLRHDAKRQRRLLVAAVLWLVVNGLGSAAAYNWLNSNAAAGDWSAARSWWLAAVIAGALILAAAVFLLGRGNRAWARSALIVLVALETVVYGSFYNSATKKNDFFPVTGAMTFLQNAYQKNHARVLPVAGMLPPNLSTWYGFNQVNDYDAVGLASWQNLKSGVGRFEGSWEKINQVANWPATQFLGAAYIIAPSSRAADLTQSVPSGRQLVYEDETAVILEQPALPPVYWLNEDDLVQPTEAITEKVLEQIGTGAVEPQTEFYLNGNKTIDYKTERAGVLIVNESYYPGWTARLDNDKLVIENWRGLKAVKAPAGEHRIVLRYEPLSLKIGWALALAGLLIIIGWRLLGCKISQAINDK